MFSPIRMPNSNRRVKKALNRNIRSCKILYTKGRTVVIAPHPVIKCTRWLLYAAISPDHEKFQEVLAEPRNNRQLSMRDLRKMRAS